VSVGKHSVASVVGLAVAGGLLNFLLAGVMHLLEIPLYFDSIATILVALHLGLFPAVVTAVVSHLLLGYTGLVLLPFLCCSLMTALIAAGFRYKGWLESHAGYLWMGVVLALANGIGGSILSYVLFEGVTMVHAIDRLVMGILMTGRSDLTSVFWAGMVTNLMDKLLSVLVVFVVREPVLRLLDKTVGASKLKQR
jgi:energy-coupling factor transport system substrate-specific component